MHFRRNILAGVITLIPLAITVFFFGFVFEVFSTIGTPLVEEILSWFSIGPDWTLILYHPWMQSFLAFLLTLLALYLLGEFTSWVIGQKMLQAFESLVTKIPLVETFYGGSKKLIESFKVEKGAAQRVVLIDFPHEHMKTVGLVTATFEDTKTGEELSAVYVPTTPNPTSGYLEIVASKHLVPTDWKIEEAMTFIITGGAAFTRGLTITKPEADLGPSDTPDNKPDSTPD